MFLVLGKARSCRVPNLGCRGSESPGWFDVSPKNSAQDVLDEWAHCYDEAANHQLSIAAAFCIIWIVSRGMFKLNAKFHADSLLYLLSHFECNGHTVHMLTQWGLLPPLRSTVKSSLFMHKHSSPLSLPARLHWCHVNRSRYVNNGWTFSRQTLYRQKHAEIRSILLNDFLNLNLFLSPFISMNFNKWAYLGN